MQYKWISYIVALMIACVYSLKLYDELHNERCEHDKPKSKAQILRQLLYGAFGSGLVCVLICELLIYFAQLPFGLSLVIGAWCGYMGADIVKDFILRFIDKKIDKGA